MKPGRIMLYAALVGLAAAVLASCSGNGESGNKSGNGITLSALILPEQVSVVDPKTTTTPKPALPANSIMPLTIGAVATDLSATSDYMTDRVSVYVGERSLDSFKSVNEILCSIRQSRYDVMVNKGPYKAQVDTNLCRSDRDSASNAGQSSTNTSSGAGMPVYENWTVNSYRPSATSPHYVDVWVHSAQNSNDPPTVIYAKLVISEGADTAPPYGIFRANFKILDPNDLTNVLARGFLNAERDPASGKVLLKFSTEDANSYAIQKATLDKSPDGSGGAGTVLQTQSYPGMTPTTTRFNLAYDDTNFLRIDNVGNEVCSDRTAFDVTAWRYGLYSAGTRTGRRVKVNSGFSVKTGSGAYGWIGYWGTWFPNGTTIKNNDTVMKHDYLTNTDTPFTVIRVDGKLKKHTRHEATLGEIRNIPLVWWDNTGNTYEVVWDSTADPGVFSIIAQQDTNNGAWRTLTPAQPFDLTQLSWIQMGFWSQSLGGMVIVNFPPPLNYGDPPSATNCGSSAASGFYDCSLAANAKVPVIYYSENIVYPTDPVPSWLACFDNCPDVSALATDTPYKLISDYQPVSTSTSTPAIYAFDPATMMLYDGAASVVTTTTGSNFTGGITSGPLFDPAILTAATSTPLLGCDWNPTGETCGGKAWSALPEFYTWETGPNEWNKFTGLIDAYGNTVKFDPPLQVQYTHHDPASEYDNVTFFLQYNGFGDLQGIPGACINMDTGLTADCSTGSTDPAVRWVPEFTIPDADASGNLTELTNVVNGDRYFIKALEKEQRMAVLPNASCSLLETAAQAYTLPSMSSWIDPVIGSEPVVNAPPAVVGGVVQGE